MRHLIVPPYSTAQQILNFYKKKAAGKNELVRIQVAKTVCQEWAKEKITLPLPAVPANEDYWYLVQLYFLDRHVHANLQPYTLHLDKSEHVYIESSKSKKGEIFSYLCDMARRDKFMNLPRMGQLHLSRKALDQLIQKYHDVCLKKIGFDPQRFIISHFPFDIYLRLADQLKLQSNTNIHLAGYRWRLNGDLTGLFGGNPLFGGPAFVDSVWSDTTYTSIIPQLVIIRKDHGYAA